MITELKRWRGRSGLTQREAARVLDISQAYFSLLERGARTMTTELRRRLEDIPSGDARALAGISGREHFASPIEDAADLNLGDVRERAHALLDLLTPKRLCAVRQLLEDIAD